MVVACSEDIDNSDVNSKHPKWSPGLGSTNELELFGTLVPLQASECVERKYGCTHTCTNNKQCWFPEHWAATPMLRSASTLSTTPKHFFFLQRKEEACFFLIIFSIRGPKFVSSGLNCASSFLLSSIVNLLMFLYGTFISLQQVLKRIGEWSRACRSICLRRI